MKRLLNWLRPSLARRLVLALLLAFGLVGVVLLAQSYYEFRQEFAPSQDSALVKAVQVVGNSLAPLRDAHDAAIVLQTIQRQSLVARQHSRLEGILLMELVDPAGRRVYATPELGDITLDAPATGQRAQQIHGRSYRVAQASAGLWQLRFGEPRLTDRSALSILLAEFMPSLLLAFPFVLLPLWFAVRQGLRPLRQLSAGLAQRHEDDLSPLGVDMRYAELKPVVGAFNELLAKLQEKVQRERAFVQDAAHELRTPMAVIAAQAHVLARAASEAERHQAEGALEHAIARASHLAQQLLALASLDDTPHVPPQRVDIAHLLQTTLAQATPLARQGGIELSLDAPDSLLIDTDLSALQSIVMNLVDNALHHGHSHGRPDAQVAVSLQSDGEQITLTVADNGPGIPEAERAHIFDRFVRGTAPAASGTGLGLAIVRRAVTRLRGHVQIAPGLNGQGVAFVVRIPALLA